MKYADAGVNIAVADDAKQRIRHLASHTFTPAVLGGIGGFGALFALDTRKWKEPVLVSSADGVGTKLKVAMSMGVHSTVGGDLVNHCVNDISGAGGGAAVFFGLPGDGQAGAQRGGAVGGWHEPVLPEGGMRADWRRNRGDAGILSRRGNMIWRASSLAWWSGKIF